jgi:hypothetical protein
LRQGKVSRPTGHAPGPLWLPGTYASTKRSPLSRD